MNDVEQEPASRGGKRMLSAFAAAGLLGVMLEYAVRGLRPDFRIYGADGWPLLMMSATWALQCSFMGFSRLKASRPTLVCAVGWVLMTAYCVMELAADIAYRQGPSFDPGWAMMGLVVAQSVLLFVIAAKNKRECGREIAALAVVPLLYMVMLILSDSRSLRSIATLLALAYRVIHAFACLFLLRRSIEVGPRSARTGFLLLFVISVCGIVNMWTPSIVVPRSDEVLLLLLSRIFSALTGIGTLAGFVMLSSASRRAALLGGMSCLLSYVAITGVPQWHTAYMLTGFVCPSLWLLAAVLRFAAFVQLRDQFPRWGMRLVMVWAGFRLFGGLWPYVNAYCVFIGDFTLLRGFQRITDAVGIISQIGSVALVVALAGLIFCRPHEDSEPLRRKFRLEVFAAWIFVVVAAVCTGYSVCETLRLGMLFQEPVAIAMLFGGMMRMMSLAAAISVLVLLCAIAWLAYVGTQAKICQRLRSVGLCPSAKAPTAMSSLRLVALAMCALAVVGAAWFLMLAIGAEGEGLLQKALVPAALVAVAWNWFGLFAHFGTIGEIVGMVRAAAGGEGGDSAMRRKPFVFVEFFACTIFVGSVVHAVVSCARGAVGPTDVAISLSGLVGSFVFVCYVRAMLNVRRELQSICPETTEPPPDALVVLRVLFWVAFAAVLYSAVAYPCTATFAPVNFLSVKPGLAQVAARTAVLVWVAWICLGTARVLSLLEECGALCGTLAKLRRDSEAT